MTPAQELPPLPLGTSSFTELRRFGQVYVDKTEMVCRLASVRGRWFLARPPRFGKTLLVSTFETLFRGGLESFSGLASEKLWHGRAYPVAKIDLSPASEFSFLEEFRRSLADACRRAFEPLGFTCSPGWGQDLARQVSSWMGTLPG